MYSGTTLTPLKFFDAWFGAHQKIDRAARRHMRKLWQSQLALPFPTGHEILKFEGANGPDGIKRKTPGQDEPRHFFDPHDITDDALLEILGDHYGELVKALRSGNRTRAAFEAAWLSHALVDGLTPAHHYPYEKELLKLRGGQGIESASNVKERLLMHGDTLSERVGNNWKMWGDKGLLATHIAFEYGIAVMIVPLRLRLGRPNEKEVHQFTKDGLDKTFRRFAKQVAELNMYETFYKSGWTPRLAKQARRELVPMIVKMVTLAWYGALQESQKAFKK